MQLSNSFSFLASVLALCLLLPVAAFAQSATVSGSVTDESGMPLVGANVETTSAYATTDSTGYFTLEAGDTDTELTVSYSGYATQTVTFDAQSGDAVTIVMIKEEE